jgi:hypothetical protein
MEKLWTCAEAAILLDVSRKNMAQILYQQKDTLDKPQYSISKGIRFRVLGKRDMDRLLYQRERPSQQMLMAQRIKANTIDAVCGRSVNE